MGEVQLALRAHEARERAAYWRAGLIAATLVNLHRAKPGKPARPEDFIPRRRTRAAPQSAEEMRRRLEAATLALGGTVVRGH